MSDLEPPFFNYLGHPVEADQMTDDQREIMAATERDMGVEMALSSDIPGEIGAMLAAMTERGWWVEIKTPFQPGSHYGDLYWVGLTPLGTTGWDGRPDVQVADETLRSALYRAVLLALSLPAEGEGESK